MDVVHNNETRRKGGPSATFPRERKINLLLSIQLPIVMVDSTLSVRPITPAERNITAESKIDGAVMTALDVHEPKERSARAKLTANLAGRPTVRF